MNSDFFDENSKVLILGTIPSPKSREQGFYYGHPRNRFWMVLADILKEELPKTIDEKKDMLKKNGIALWDVLESCEIKRSIRYQHKNPKANDMNDILFKADIRAIFATEQKKHISFMKKLCYPKCGVRAVRLPSTSPANCGCSYEKLTEEYGQILEYLDK